MAMDVYMTYSVELVPLGTSLVGRLNEQAKAGWEAKMIMPNANGYEVVFQKFVADIPTWNHIACEPEMG